MNDSLFSQNIIVPRSKSKLLLMLHNSMALSLAVFPVTFICNIPDF